MMTTVIVCGFIALLHVVKFCVTRAMLSSHRKGKGVYR